MCCVDVSAEEWTFGGVVDGAKCVKGFEVAEGADDMEEVAFGWGGAFAGMVLCLLDDVMADSGDVVEIADNALILSLVGGCGVVGWVEEGCG